MSQVVQAFEQFKSQIIESLTDLVDKIKNRGKYGKSQLQVISNMLSQPVKRKSLSTMLGPTYS